MNDKIENAREFFGIDEFPGNLFEKITSNKDYIEQYKLFIMKDDLHNLSGFIGYFKDYAYIGINYNMPIGRQNFTLAHEIGHLFLNHRNPHVYINNENNNFEGLEKEAFDFGMELLYPQKLFVRDYQYALDNNLFSEGSRAQFAKYIDSVCHKYYLSFTAVFYRFFHCYYCQFIKQYEKDSYQTERKDFLKSLNKSLGKQYDSKYSHLDKNFYIAKNSTYSTPYYPIKQLEEKVNMFVDSGDLGFYAGQAILLKHKGLGDKNYG